MDALLSLCGFAFVVFIIFLFTPWGPLWPVTQGIIGGGAIGAIIALFIYLIAEILNISIFGLGLWDLMVYGACGGAILGIFITFPEVKAN